MTMLQIASLLVVLAGVFGSVNYFFLRLPASIGILVVALAASIAVMTLDRLVPGIGIGDAVRGAVMDIEFSEALLHSMLGLLLFAGALHVRADLLREQALPVALITLVGVLISTAIAGFGFAWITGFPILVAMVFGALISPTDPVAVLGVLREAKLRNRWRSRSPARASSMMASATWCSCCWSGWRSRWRASSTRRVGRRW